MANIKLLLTRTTAVIWLLLSLLLATCLLFTIPMGLRGLALPYLVGLLSLFVFNKAPRMFRYLHHIFVIISMVFSGGIAYYFAFHGGEQGGVGAYLTILGFGSFYLVFITFLILMLAFWKWLKQT